MKMWVMNLGKPVAIPSLNEAMAIELGANLLGEAIIFTVAAGVLILEYTRQSRKESAKEEARKDELNHIHYTINELYFQAEKQDAQIRELMRMISDLERKVIIKPWVPPSTPLQGDDDSSETESNSGIIKTALTYVVSDVL
jgi:hypothetical protein